MHKPFSPYLNKFITDWFTKNQHLFSQYSEPQFDFNDVNATFQAFQDHWYSKGTIPMWYDDNEDNIFASTTVNGMFRAWHDFIHIITGNDFTLQGEINSYEVQQAFLPADWKYEKSLMKAEIIGQAEFYTANPKGKIDSQRKFTQNYMKLEGYYVDFGAGFIS